MSYPFAEIEPKWQKRWEESKIFEVEIDHNKEKFYCLDMFPYPSGRGLHVGHVASYTPTDIISRYKRAKGFNVLHPMGWDAFGLPAEQHAIKTGIHPEKTTHEAIDNFRRQMKMLGYSYDWSREVATCDPSYYKWTQYIFTILYKKGLAYQKEMPVNWCPALKTVLANEEVINGKSERGGHPVEKRMMKQWMLKITAFAEKLLEGLDKIDWVDRTKEGQRNWIGKSEGLQGTFGIKDHDLSLEIFTTRPDTIYGVTFMVLAPEHPYVEKITTDKQRSAVESYQKQAASKSDLERQVSTDKTGVFTGAYAINPINNQEIPIWVSDYVLMDYGTGAIMAVPGHDERDYEFAKEFDLSIIPVIQGPDDTLPYSGEGACINSDLINGLEKNEAISKIINEFEKNSWGQKTIQYKLRDWLFSRQRYWGEPFPVIHFSDKASETLTVNDLPVTLPEISDYEPSETGEAPLSKADDAWLNANDGKRETDTMPGSAGSSWYFLRYTDPHNENEICSKEAESYWMPVDLYIGGPEHTVGHLLYSRFWQKVLHEEGLVSHDEPFQKLVHQGMVLGSDGEKMSKSRGNTINPDEVVENYGTDALRTYIMFMGPLDRDKPWSQNGLVGVYKFLNKAWRMIFNDDGSLKIDNTEPSENLLRVCHQTIKKVSEDIEKLSYNTAISQLMIFVNEFTKAGACPKTLITKFIQLLAPFAPHFAEECWEKLGKEGFVSLAPWPDYDENLAKADKVTIAIQVNGKTKGTLEFEENESEETVTQNAKNLPTVAKLLEAGGEIKKIVFVKNRILNLIIKS